MKHLRLFLFICSCLVMTHASAEGEALVSYKEPRSADEVVIAKRLKAATDIPDVMAIINENFRLQEDLEFVFGAEDGPLYDPGINKIWIPYAFIEEVKERFVAANYAQSGVSADDATMDSLLHTLFHELAHALIYRYELPVVGKEEDAADALATVLLIRFFEDGQELAISAADLFDLESEESESELTAESFWDEHSLDSQRYYSTLCHVYGSAPEKYGNLLAESEFSENRAEGCIEEYEILLSSWLKLLAPHMKHD